jgi:hypothetical protein
MNMIPLALEGAWKVLAAGLVLGAGLPILYAFAVRGLAMAQGAGAIIGEQTAKPFGKVICLGAVAGDPAWQCRTASAFIVATGDRQGRHLRPHHPLVRRQAEEVALSRPLIPGAA